jgi:hypothetical protein
MKTAIKRFTLPVLGLLSATLAFNGATALAAELCVNPGGTGGCYKKIQKAVDDAQPGDTVKVSAGIYNEDQIVINKRLKVLGAGANRTIINGRDAHLTKVGLVRITGDGDVTLSGFTLRDAGASLVNPLADVSDWVWVRVGLFASSTATVAGNKYTITDNKIVGSGNKLDDQDYGFYAYGGEESLVFQDNEVTDTGANAVLIELHAGPTDISYNTLDVGVWGADAIFTMTYGDLDVETPQKRNNNVINVGTGGPFNENHRAGGITFASAYRNPPYDAVDADIGEGQFTEVQIMRNIIYNVQAERRGIVLWNGDIDGHPKGGNIVEPQVVGNVISGVDRHPGGRNGNGSIGIQLLGLVSDANLRNNDFADLDIGIHLGEWFGSVPSHTQINNNRFDDVGTRVEIDD